ncbi:MAG TPA: ubiquinol oxidase subunit II [Aliidongia sp.]|nr:ubiquinol oxidase subunit II [Aliidongia sp.]
MVKAGGGNKALTILRHARRLCDRRVAGLAFAAFLGGCSSGVMDPQGPVGSAEKTILFNSLGIMLAIVVPTIFATLGVAWWFRASNTRAHYLPDWEYSGRLEMVVWSIPAMTVLLLGGIGWIGSHDLDPPKPIASTTNPIEVEVVSLDWKWLFIYPDLGIASVNSLIVPAGAPISFALTSDGVMNSFFVPQLGSQIYTMPGMVTRLQLEADNPGSYPGLSAQFSGDGFSDMRFILEAVPPDQFTQWVKATRGKGPTLDPRSFAELAQPSEAVAPKTYGAVTQDLFPAIVHPTQPGPAGHTEMRMEK